MTGSVSVPLPDEANAYALVFCIKVADPAQDDLITEIAAATQLAKIHERDQIDNASRYPLAIGVQTAVDGTKTRVSTPIGV